MATCTNCKTTLKDDATFCNYCGASHTPVMKVSQTPDNDLDEQIRHLLRRDEYIPAVKFYKDATKIGLKESKDYVDRMRAQLATMPSPVVEEGDWQAQVMEYLRLGRKLDAIKLYRERTGKGLADSKRAVEEMAERAGLSQQRGGCFGMVLLVILLAVVIAGVYTA